LLTLMISTIGGIEVNDQDEVKVEKNEELILS
jgi:hypothetical protein